MSKPFKLLTKKAAVKVIGADIYLTIEQVNFLCETIGGLTTRTATDLRNGCRRAMDLPELEGSAFSDTSRLSNETYDIFSEILKETEKTEKES